MFTFSLKGEDNFAGSPQLYEFEGTKISNSSIDEGDKPQGYYFLKERRLGFNTSAEHMSHKTTHPLSPSSNSPTTPLQLTNNGQKNHIFTSESKMLLL